MRNCLFHLYYGINKHVLFKTIEKHSQHVIITKYCKMYSMFQNKPAHFKGNSIFEQTTFDRIFLMKFLKSKRAFCLCCA